LVTSVTSGGARERSDLRKPLLTGSDVPVPVRAILERACHNCHSEDTVWPWYAHVPPASQVIQRDVTKARAFLDLSKWNDYTDGERRGFALAIAAATQNRLMPPQRYLWMHGEARLTDDDLESIKAWALSVSRDSVSSHSDNL
jgi:hypothetical protein